MGHISKNLIFKLIFAASLSVGFSSRHVDKTEAASMASSAESKDAPAVDTSDAKNVAQDGETVYAQVRRATNELKNENTIAARIKALTELEGFLKAESQKPEDTVAVQFDVALEPLLSRKQEIGNAKSCKEMRGLMVFQFAGGTGFDGRLPEFVLESLSLLAAACQDASLKDPDLDR